MSKVQVNPDWIRQFFLHPPPHRCHPPRYHTWLLWVTARWNRSARFMAQVWKELAENQTAHSFCFHLDQDISMFTTRSVYYTSPVSVKTCWTMGLDQRSSNLKFEFSFATSYRPPSCLPWFPRAAGHFNYCPELTNGKCRKTDLVKTKYFPK